MKKIAYAAAFALLSTPVFAQDTTALAEQYVNMPEVQTMIDDMFSPDTMANQFAASLPPNVTLTDDQKSQIGTLMSGAMNDLRPRLEELMTSGSAETFSAAELQALIDFYGSEHGSAIMSKMQPFFTNVMAQMAPEMQEMQQKITPQLIQIIQGN